MRKILFRHNRALGDTLMFTAGIRDFKLLFPEISINAKTSFPELFANNPYIDGAITNNTPGVECYTVGYPTIQHCNGTFNHFTSAFLFDMIAMTDGHKPLIMSIGELCSAFSGGRVGDMDCKFHEGDKAKEPFVSWRKRFKSITEKAFRKCGDLHMSDSEKKTKIISANYDIERYWVIAPGGKRDCTAKIWDWRKFQKVIDHFDGYIKFVVIGKRDLLVEPLRGTINLVGKLKIRELLPLVYHADGCVSGVSFLMHLAAAIPPRNKKEIKPCVSIYGGREPVSFTGYDHQILHTIGAMPCCDYGGCWVSHLSPDQEKATGRICNHIVSRGGRKIQQCMDMISADDVIRAIEIYYQGNKGLKKYKPMKRIPVIVKGKRARKEINILASMKSDGGGEQSANKIVTMLRAAGWIVHFYPWDGTHKRFGGARVEPHTFKNGMSANMRPGLPLLFYGNDNVSDFCSADNTSVIAEKSSKIIVGINYVNGGLPKANWVADKVAAVIFQNSEKRAEFDRDAIGFEHTERVEMYGAIDIDNYVDLAISDRADGGDLVVLKHCKPDYRKYVTEKSVKGGDRPHTWQRNIIKETDIKFYTRLLNDMGRGIRFEFMEAHEELKKAFPDNPQMVFHAWDSMPVREFLKRGHLYLYRTSNHWRDQYPLCVAEALAAGVPVLTEPRDGTYDRVIHGDTGFHCIDYDGFLYAIRLLKRKEKFRKSMGERAKQWARENLRPEKWVDTIERLCGV